MDNKFYTGIGSRQTPKDVLELMTAVASKLAGMGWRLRSGHAEGADRAFEKGAGGNADIYLPWSTFGIKKYKDDPGCPVLGNALPLGFDTYDHNYRRLEDLGIRYRTMNVNKTTKLMHGRNVCQVEGHQHPMILSRMVICWTPVTIVKGEPMGGTATAIKLAEHHGIQVINLLDPDMQELVRGWL